MLKIRGKRKEILKAMQDASKTTPGKTTMEILNSLLLEANDGELRIRSTNLDASVEIAVEVTVEEGGAMAIEAKSIIEFLSKVYSDEISLTQDESCLKVGYDLCSEAKIRTTDEKQFPNFPIVERQEGNSIIMKAVDFKEMAEKVVPACASDNTRPILAGVLLDISEDNLTIVALDGFRLIKSHKAIEGVKINKKIVMPGKALLNAVKLIGNDKEAEVEVIASDYHVEVGYMGTKFISRLLEGEFVDYTKIIPQTDGMTVKAKINAGQVKEVADRVSLLAEQNDKRILDIQLKENTLKFAGESAYGSAVESIEVAEASGEIEISIDTKYLLDALTAFVGDCTIYMTSATSPAVIEDPTGDTTALLLPVRKKPVVTKAA